MLRRHIIGMLKENESHCGVITPLPIGNELVCLQTMHLFLITLLVGYRLRGTTNRLDWT